MRRKAGNEDKINYFIFDGISVPVGNFELKCGYHYCHRETLFINGFNKK